MGLSAPACNICVSQEESHPAVIDSRCVSRLIGDDKCRVCYNESEEAKPSRGKAKHLTTQKSKAFEKVADTNTKEATDTKNAKQRAESKKLAMSPTKSPDNDVEGISDGEENTKDNEGSVDLATIYEVMMSECELDNCLLLAAYSGNAKKVKECLANDGLPTAQDAHGFWAGFHAALSGDLETLMIILRADEHRVYKDYFENKITKEKMTPLMSVVRNTQPEVWQCIMKEVGCSLKLIGDKYGVPDDPDGRKQPLYKWLEFVPEISTLCQTPKRRPLYLSNRVIDLNKPPTEAEYLAAREHRLQARNFVRKLVGSFQKEDEVGKISHENTPAAGARNKRGAIAINVDLNALEQSTSVKKSCTSTSQTKKNCTSTSLASKSSGNSTLDRLPNALLQARMPNFDVEAYVVPGKITIRKKAGTKSRKGAPKVEEVSSDAASANMIQWICGSCSSSHDQPLTQSTVVPCDSCSMRNYVRLSGPAESPQLSEDDSGGETWENAATEIISEKIVNSYLKMFKGCLLMNFGTQKMRQLLRIVTLEDKCQNADLFKEEDDLTTIHVLQSGTVEITERHLTQFTRKKLSVENGKDGKPVLQVIDVNSFLQALPGERKVHRCSCRVISETAKIFSFGQDAAAEHCSIEHLEVIIQNSLSNAICSAIPLFKIAFDDEERLKISESLCFEEYPDSHIVIVKGQRLSGIILIQSGTLTISQDKKTKIVHVNPTPIQVPHGEYWKPFYIIGVRLLLFDLPSQSNIEVKGGIAQAWSIEQVRADHVLRETNLLHHLQNGTYILFLKKCIFFMKLNNRDPRLLKLLGECKTCEYWVDEEMIVEGRLGESLFVLMEGTVEVTKDGKLQTRLSANVDEDKVQTFGEMTIVEPQLRISTVKVISDSATALEITREIICEIFGSVEELLIEQGSSLEQVMEIWHKKVSGKGDLDLAKAASQEGKTKQQQQKGKHMAPEECADVGTSADWRSGHAPKYIYDAPSPHKPSKEDSNNSKDAAVDKKELERRRKNRKCRTGSL